MTHIRKKGKKLYNRMTISQQYRKTRLFICGNVNILKHYYLKSIGFQ